MPGHLTQFQGIAKAGYFFHKNTRHLIIGSAGFRKYVYSSQGMAVVPALVHKCIGTGRLVEKGSFLVGFPELRHIQAFRKKFTGSEMKGIQGDIAGILPAVMGFILKNSYRKRVDIPDLAKNKILYRELG